MRVAYVTTYDARDTRNWSGLGTRIGQALQEQGVDVQFVGPLREAWGPVFKAKHAVHKLVLRQSYAREREPVIARGYARQVLQQVDGRGVDAIVSPGTIPISLLDCPQPIVTWSDSTLAGLLGYYANCDRLSRGSVRRGLALERQAAGRIAAAVFTSQWAADSAVRDCGADPARVHVVPFGAIIPDPPTAAAALAAAAARPTDRCQVLFVAVDWQRKGAAVAIDAVAEMNRAGLPTELVMVGGTPPGPLPAFVRPLGFVDKGTAPGRAAFDRLLAGSHFLILPSTAEAFGLAPCEANAHAVPALVAATGGLTEVVRDGINGYALPPGCPPADYARRMLDLLRAPAAYQALCAGARREYEARLNWGVAGRRVREILEEVVAERARPRGAP